jgi:hypothetical protein
VPPRETDDPQAGMVVLVTIVGSIALVAIIVATQALFYYEKEADFRRKNYVPVVGEVRTLADRQLTDLNSYRWINEADGVVGIPIDEAMRLTVRELSAPR